MNEEDSSCSSLEAEIAREEASLRRVARRRRTVRARVEEVGAAADRCGRALNEATRDLAEAASELRSVVARTRDDLAWLRATERTHATNDCLHVWYRGRYGTINGSRLGGEVRDPGAAEEEDAGTPARDPRRVPWSEFNAALGTAALLLAVLEEDPATPLCFTRHRPRPRGHFSRIVVSPPPGDDRPPATHDLFRVDDESSPLAAVPVLGGLFATRDRDLDRALRALAACLAEAAEQASAVDRTFAETLPHPVTTNPKDGTVRVGGLALDKAGNDGDGDRWTRALRYFLTDLKWLVAFAVKHAET